MLAAFFNEKLIEAGCDEAGRGCMAGPVVAAAVVLPKDFKNDLLNDSKQLSERQRKSLRGIIENEALAYCVEVVSAQEVDEINVLNASIAGMQRAASKLVLQPDHLLVDGNRFHPFNIPHTCFVKGDGKFMAIAAASILAKTYRDALMMELHKEYPMYGWDKNKGYPTAVHRKAMENHGLSPFHRKTFQFKTQQQLEIPFE